MLRRYHRDYPNVFLSCCRHNSKELTEALLSGALDMIFTWDHDPIMAMPQIEYVEVGTHRWMWCSTTPTRLCTVRSCAGKI